MTIEDKYANTIVEDDLSERWQKTFTRIGNGETGLYTWSILGFLFGPAYYLYLRMFKKGFVIIGFIFAGWFFGALLEMVIGKDLGGAINFAACVFCAKRVKTDYYRFKCLDEINWPQMKPIDSVGALSAFVGLFAVGIVTIAAIAGMDRTSSVAEPSSARSTFVATEAQQEAYNIKLQREAGISGAECWNGRINLKNVVLQLRKSGVPLDQAMDAATDPHDDRNLRGLMYESVRALYADPDAVMKAVNSGAWMSVCIRTVRGY